MFKRLNSYQRGYNLAWNKYSKSYRRDNPWCVMCLPKLVAAQCVDHIKPISGKDDPLFWEPGNHQSLCWTCHSIKTATEDGGSWSGGALTHPTWLPKPGCRVTIVCGPPGSGKTTYAKDKGHTIDLDDCFMDVCKIHGHDAPREYLTMAMRRRNTLLATLEHETRHAWFVIGAPTKAEQAWWADALNADVVVMDTDKQTCTDRLQHSIHYDDRLAAIATWFSKAAQGIWKPPRKKITTGLDGWPIGE